MCFFRVSASVSTGVTWCVTGCVTWCHSVGLCGWSELHHQYRSLEGGLWTGAESQESERRGESASAGVRLTGAMTCHNHILGENKYLFNMAMLSLDAISCPVTHNRKGKTSITIFEEERPATEPASSTEPK